MFYNSLMMAYVFKALGLRAYIRNTVKWQRR